VMLITTGGILIRTRVSEIREMGRATQGVTLIALDGGTRLSGLQRVVERDSDIVNGDGLGAVTEPGDGLVDGDPAQE